MSLSNPTPKIIGLSLVTCVFTLTGFEISGWAGDEDGFGTEKKNYIDFFQGPNGASVGIVRGDKSETIVIKLLQNSLSVPFLNEKLNKTITGVPEELEGLVFDPRSGSTYKLGAGYVMAGKKFPSLGVGNQGTMEYDLYFKDTTSTINNSAVTF